MKPASLLMTFRSFTHRDPALISTDQPLLQLGTSLKQVQFSSSRLLTWLFARSAVPRVTMYH